MKWKSLEPLQKNKPLMFLSAAINAFIMMVAVLYYMNLPYVLPDEILLIEGMSIFKNALFKAEEKPPRDRFLFVNCAWENDLIPKLDSNGFEIGNIEITSRKSISKMLQVMNQEPDNHEFLLVDVRFYLESDDDSLMEAEFNKLPNVLVSYHKGPKNKPNYPVVDVPIGLSDMEGQDLNHEEKIMLKYHIVQGDSLKTTPLLMYEKIHQDTLQEGSIYDYLAGERIFNAFIMDYPIRKHDLFAGQKYNYIQMKELINLPPFLVHEYTKDRIIVVGDFEDRDIHKTIYGYQPGPLILLNAFLDLEKGDNQVSNLFLLFIFVSFLIISYKAIMLRDPITIFLEKRLPTDSFIIEMTKDTLFYLVYFAVVSAISYVFFKTHLTILILAFYVFGIEQFNIFLDSSLKERHEKKKKELSEKLEVVSEKSEE